MNNATINFNHEIGKIKPLNAVCCAPFYGSLGDNQKIIDKMFKDANIPYSRLHDCMGIFNTPCLVDIPKIFKDFDADENDPTSYDFHHTDEYIGAIQKAGAEAYYRLGVSIEWSSKKYISNPPKDFLKWARICEHVIMHYNEGWANGFKYGLKYWEIWNEPENPGNSFGPCMWAGTKEEFFSLYNISTKYLKNKFPQLKFGGYGGCGFYAVSRKNVHSSRKDFVTYFTDFLEMVKKEDCPLDFYSWHIYTHSPEEIIEHGNYVRKTLDEYGFNNTESHLNEWNYNAEGTGFNSKHTMEGGSFLTKSMTLMQNSNIDMAMYYTMSSSGMYNGFIDHNDDSISASWYPFVSFGHIYKLGTHVKTGYDGDVQVIASKNSRESAILITNHKCDDDRVTLKILGIVGKRADVIVNTDQKHLFKEVSFDAKEDMTIELSVPKNTVMLIKFY